MSKKKTNNIDHLEEQMKTKAETGKMLLFYQFICPHCQTQNVSSKDYAQKFTLCSNPGCRKMIIIENYKDIA